jgi:hypothetical protein
MSDVPFDRPFIYAGVKGGFQHALAPAPKFHAVFDFRQDSSRGSASSGPA